MNRKCCALIFCLCGSLFYSVEGQCAETLTYEDEYVSFEYADDVNCEISYRNSENSSHYVCLTKMMESDPYDISTDIMIIGIDYYEKFSEIEPGTWKEHYFSERSDDYSEREIVSNGDLPEIKITYKDDTGNVGYTRLLGYSESDFAVAVCTLNQSAPQASDLCQAIYDSAKVSEYYSNNGYVFAEDIAVDTIYTNVILSDQAVNYANAAIDVLEQYLSLELDADAASEQIEDIQARANSYSEYSEYEYDSNVSSKLRLTSLAIDMGNDASVYETLQTLKQLIGLN